MIVTLEMALSPNGYIARENGEEDWLSSDNWSRFLDRAQETNNIVMGRKTYEMVTELYPHYNFDDVPCKTKIIVSRTLRKSPKEGYEVVVSPEEAIKRVAALGHSELLLIGGGNLNTSFLEKDLVNNISLTYEPYLLGGGRVFTAPGDFEYSLNLKSVETVKSGHVLVRYEVKK